MISKWLVAAVAVLAAVTVGAAEGQLYKCKGKNGETIYSDQPCPGAEVLPMKETPTFAAPPPPTQLPPINKGPAKAQARSYQIAVTQPAPDEVLRDNEGAVSVQGTVSPGLGDDHKIRLLLDGQPYGEPGNQTSWSLTNVDRGEHSVVIEVFDTRSGKSVQASPAVKFMLFRTSGNTRTPAPGTDGAMTLDAQPHWPSLSNMPAQPGDTVPAAPSRPAGGPRR